MRRRVNSTKTETAPSAGRIVVRGRELEMVNGPELLTDGYGREAILGAK